MLTGNYYLNELAAGCTCETHFLDLSLSHLYLSLHSLSLSDYLIHVAAHTHSAESFCHFNNLRIFILMNYILTLVAEMNVCRDAHILGTFIQVVKFPVLFALAVLLLLVGILCACAQIQVLNSELIFDARRYLSECL